MSKQLRSMPKRFKRKVLLIVGGLSAIATGALAAILITAGVTGTLSTVAKPSMSFSSSDNNYPTKVVSTDGSGIVCEPTVSAGKLNLTIRNAMPGSSCKIQTYTSLRSAGAPMPVTDMALKVQEFSLSGLETTLHKERATGGATGQNTSLQCGDLLSAGTSDSQYIRMPYIFTVTVPNDAGTVSGKAISGQVSVVPAAQFDPAACNN